MLDPRFPRHGKEEVCANLFFAKSFAENCMVMTEMGPWGLGILVSSALGSTTSAGSRKVGKGSKCIVCSVLDKFELFSVEVSILNLR